MIKSTTRIFKEKVQAYILDAISDEYLQECGHDTSTPEKKVIAVYKQMCNEWWKGYEKKRTPNRYTALKEYLMCLPSAFSVDFEYYKIRQIIKEWYEMTDAEIDRWTDGKTADRFYYLVSLNFYYIYDKAIKQ